LQQQYLAAARRRLQAAELAASEKPEDRARARAMLSEKV
jgi:hypothetical protein